MTMRSQKATLKLEKVDLENYKTFRKGKYKKEKMNFETRKKLIEY